MKAGSSKSLPLKKPRAPQRCTAIGVFRFPQGSETVSLSLQESVASDSDECGAHMRQM